MSYTSAGNRKTVLYVEDAVENRILVRRVLMAEGFQVVEAGSANEAYQVLTQTSPDLILMDINMPDVDGYTLTAEIRKMPKHSQIPIIAVTANVMRGDKERTLEAGCNGYIQKPIDIDILPNQIYRYLSR